MNVLLTSVGRRSYLVEYFKEAVQPNGRVIAANSDPLTSGMLTADVAYTVPQVDSAEYIPALLEICHTENIKMVISLFDIDLPYLSNARAQFSALSVELVVSDPWVIEIANDKWKTWQFLNKNNILTPKSFLKVSTVNSAIEAGLINYPLIIKPRWGMGSLSIFRADNEEELNFFYKYIQKQIEKSYLNILSREQISEAVIIQEFISGKEYGLDVFNDLQGQHLQTIPKYKLAMRSGETDMAKVVNDERLKALGTRLAEIFAHRGNLDVDILENSEGILYVLEMNARFGGGYPFSHLAGANFPAALVAMVQGKVPKMQPIDTDCIGLKGINLIKSTN